MSRGCHFLLLIIFVASPALISAQHRKYVGSPATDSNFVSFIKKNLSKTVSLRLSISNGEMISEGYRGVQPMFEGKKTDGIDYSFFLECPSDPDLTPIEECKGAAWTENGRGGGILSGSFKISRIIKTSMRNYRAVFLVPVRR